MDGKIYFGKCKYDENIKTIYLKLNYDPNLPLSYDCLNLKKEFHLTIIGNKTALKLSKENRTLNYDELCYTLEKSLNKSFLSFTNEFWLVKKKSNNKEKRSIIQLVKTDFLKNSFNALNLGEMDYFPHITLYKEENNQGVGITSKEEFDKIKVKKIVFN